jgi:CelD/BcsL family acetyltransferase involved in cellulose biosynthesis
LDLERGVGLLSSELITEPGGLEEFHSAWDELAVENQVPMMAPACVAAWWRHMAPSTAQPHVVVLKDGEELAGVAPFYANSHRYARRVDLRLPGIELAARLAPLATPGFDPALADAVVRLLCDHTSRPTLMMLEGIQLGSGWTETLRQRWPSRIRPIVFQYKVQDSPTVSLSAESFEAWLASKSSNFRGQMRRLRRHFDEAGGSLRVSTPETLRSDVDAFVRLHAARWEGRGSSKLVALGERLPAVLNDMGQALLPMQGRFRLQLLEVQGEPVSAQLFLAAGGRVLYVNGGWDERFTRLKPATLAILEAIHEGFDHGDVQLDLGIGAQPYKLRFADGNDPISWTFLAPVDAGVPLAAIGMAPLFGRAMARRVVRR